MSSILGFNRDEVKGRLSMIEFITPVSNVILHCASLRAELRRACMSSPGEDAAPAIGNMRKNSNMAAMNLISMPILWIVAYLNVGFRAGSAENDPPEALIQSRQEF
jgi:hypothetical protein